MTPRGALLVLLAVVPVAAAAASPALLLPGLALVVAAGLLVIIDSRRAPGRDRLTVEREHEAMLSVGRDNPIRVSVEVRGRRRVPATVRDQVAPRLADAPSSGRLVLPGTFEYHVHPTSRGDEPFGGTVVRTRGPWGLGFRQVTLENDEVVPVEADLAAVREYEALARRGQLAELGVRTQRRPGEGSEFERIREAVPDDPLRMINWRATARTGRLMATALIPERSQPVIVCLDHGRLMGVGAGALTKLDHAVNAALLLFHVAIATGDRAGLLAFADSITTTLPPRSGRLQLRRFLDAVRSLQPSDIESDYVEAFTHLSSWQSRRALVCIFTDILDPDQSQALITQCVRLTRRHVPLVITVRDPALIDATRVQPMDGHATYVRAVAGTIADDRESTLRLLQRSGVETLDTDARSLSPRLVNRYLELKHRGRI
jgi:uncharacterized protein (DUF58 family)